MLRKFMLRNLFLRRVLSILLILFVVFLVGYLIYTVDVLL